MIVGDGDVVDVIGVTGMVGGVMRVIGDVSGDVVDRVQLSGGVSDRMGHWMELKVVDVERGAVDRRPPGMQLGVVGGERRRRVVVRLVVGDLVHLVAVDERRRLQVAQRVDLLLHEVEMPLEAVQLLADGVLRHDLGRQLRHAPRQRHHVRLESLDSIPARLLHPLQQASLRRRRERLYLKCKTSEKML